MASIKMACLECSIEVFATHIWTHLVICVWPHLVIYIQYVICMWFTPLCVLLWFCAGRLYPYPCGLLYCYYTATIRLPQCRWSNHKSKSYTMALWCSMASQNFDNFQVMVCNLISQSRYLNHCQYIAQYASPNIFQWTFDCKPSHLRS